MLAFLYAKYVSRLHQIVSAFHLTAGGALAFLSVQPESSWLLRR